MSCKGLGGASRSGWFLPPTAYQHFSTSLFEILDRQVGGQAEAYEKPVHIWGHKGCNNNID
jgi:hypothetical protein